MTDWLRSRRLPPLYALALVGVVALAGVLRVEGIDRESLFMDEIRQVSYYTLPFDGIAGSAASQQQPPLDYWIGHLVTRLWNTDAAARAPSALFGTATVLLLILLLRVYTGWGAALGAGMLLALSPFHIYFSQHARPYAIAIFFLLGLLWALEIVLHRDRAQWWHFLLLFFTTLGFLLSRTLAPLVVTVVLASLTSLRVVQAWLRSRRGENRPPVREVAALATMLVAGVAYLPFLRKVLQASSRYADTSPEPTALLGGLRNFSLTPAWSAFVVQTEPLAWLFVALLPMTVLALKRKGSQSERVLVVRAGLLLCGSLLLNLLVFQARTDAPFRPPYAIYLQPLLLGVAAGVVAGLWRWSQTTEHRRATRAALAGVMLLATLVSMHACWAFKTMTRITDWRATAEYASTELGSDQLLIFDAIAPFFTWEPTFYGFPRYYHGTSTLIGASELPEKLRSMAQSTLEPVLVLFAYREYRLTPSSTYAFHPTPDNVAEPDFARLNRDGGLDVTSFTGLTLVRLRSPTGQLAPDLLTLINKVGELLPEQSNLVDLELVASCLEGLRDSDGREHSCAHLAALGASRPEIRQRCREVLELCNGTFPLTEQIDGSRAPTGPTTTTHR